MLTASAVYTPTFVVLGHMATNAVKPNVTLASAPYTPAQMTAAYGVNQISFNGTPGNGAGQTIAIVDAYDDPEIISDSQTFASTYGLPQFNVTGGPSLTILNQTGRTTLPGNTTPTGWDLEESLDVQWAHSIAPQANIVVFESNTNNDDDMDAAVATAAAYPGVSAVSMSWGETEFAGEQSEDPFVLTPAGHQGVTFLASSGDGGAPPIYPSVSPNVVSVGGTSLYIQPDGTYVSETPWDNSHGADGGGPSVYEAQPSYQVGKVNGDSTTNRTSPDISIDADPVTGVPVLDTFESGWYQVGGTSLSAPMMAGLIAIANQGRTLQGEGTLNGLTQTLPTLYSASSADFNDITTGSNGTYPATVGYDMATGLGTPVANLLIPDLVDSTTNWSPTVSGPSSAATNENTTLAFSGPNAVSVGDLTAGTIADSLMLTVNDGTLTLGTTSGLTFGAGSNGSASMTVTGTVSDLDAALNTLTYTPNSGYTGGDSLALLLDDSAAHLTASTSVALTVNAPPSVTAPAGATLNENASFAFSGPNAITVTDTAAGGADSLTLSVSDGSLTLASTGGLTFGSGANGSSSMTISGTVSNLDAALAGLTYAPTSGYDGSDSLAVLITDPGDGLFATTSVGLAINPLPTISAPAAATTPENAPLTFSGLNAITVGDAFAGGNADALTLSVSDGTLTLVSTTGLTFGPGSNGSSSMTVTGTISNLDAALAGLIYTPKAGYKGADSLKLSIADSGDSLSASTSVSLTVSGPSAPTISAPASISLLEDASFSFSGGNTITVNDVSIGSGTDSLKLSVTHGTLTLGSTSGLSFTSGSNGAASMTVTGTVANLDNALAGLVYTAKTGFTGSDSLKLTITDSGDNLTASSSVSLTVSAPSPPAIAAPSTAGLYEDASFTFASPNLITVTDAAAGSGTDTMKLSVTHGTLKFGSTSGLTFTTGSNGAASMTLTGTLANLNTALAGLVYTPKTAYSGTDSLKLSLTDPLYKLSGSATVAITVSVPPSTPTATVGTPMTTSVPGEPVPLVFQVSDTNASAQSASYSFAISFGDGSSTTVSSAAPILDNHVYKSTGTFTASVTATDEFGHKSAIATVVIHVVPVAVETNPFNTSQTALFVGGTSGRDTVAFTKSGANIAVTLNGVSEGTFSTSGPFIIFGQGGKDTVTEGAGVTNTVDLLETASADNFETDADNYALQWAGLTAAVEILNR